MITCARNLMMELDKGIDVSGQRVWMLKSEAGWKKFEFELSGGKPSPGKRG
jgi:hypothetical protein